ncbi:MAG: hypothetical protein AAGA75_25625 [Cyanobacteria bacterium P01_E01_bin.6]
MKTFVYALLLSTTLMGCSSSLQRIFGQSVESSTGDTPVSDTELPLEEATSPEEATFLIGKSFQHGSLILDVQEVHLTPKQVAVQVSISNRSSQLLRFYPNQGTLSTGVDELKANVFLTDDSLSGVLEPQEQKTGVLVFSSRFDHELDFTRVRSIHLSLGQVIDMASIEPQSVDIAFSLDPAS